MKYAVVTGSTSGIGYSIASSLIKDGYYVFMNGRREYNPEFGDDKCQYVQADLSVYGGIEQLYESVFNKTDKIDALILNAGTTCRKSMADISYSDWQHVLDMNLSIPFFTVQKFLTLMNADANILFISSLMGIRPHGTSLPYGVTKAAVISLAQNLVKELDGVRVNCICPGFVDTEWQKNKPEWLREKITSKIALKRFALPEEIADMSLSVLNNKYMNGSVITIDGGYDMA